MIRYLRQFIGENVLLKITSFNSVAIGVRIITGLISSKVVAFYLGASGMALMGDLRNFLSSAQSISTLGIYNGIVKYTAQFKNDHRQLGKLLTTSFLLGGIATILTALILFFGASYWNNFLFEDGTDYRFVFQLLAIALPFYALNIFLVAVINGYARYKQIILINAVTNVLGLVITVLLIYQYNIEGALIGIVCIPSLSLLITGLVLVRKSKFLDFFNFANFDPQLIKKLASYTGMTLFSAIITPWIFIAIRQEIINSEGLTEAGYWDAMLRLSDYYLMFVTSILTMYVFPKLSATESRLGFRKEVFSFYKTILPLFGLGLVVVFFAKELLISLVFTEDFQQMKPIFQWQLIGDFFRVAAMVVAYQFLAKNMFWTFIGSQIFSLATIYLSSAYFIHHFGFEGAGMGHALSYFIYLITVLIIFKKSLFAR